VLDSTSELVVGESGGAAHGGWFALDFALAWPEQVRSLTLVSSQLGVVELDYAAVHARLRPEFFSNLPGDFQELSPSYRAGNPEGLAAWLELQQHSSQQPVVAGKMKEPLTWERLDKLACPVLLMTGDSDLYVPPSVQRMQARHIPHAEDHVVAEAGHSPNWEQPVVFNQLLVTILNKHNK
jgi:pimeloyl-ACP methyl ester carboxylesterase